MSVVLPKVRGVDIRARLGSDRYFVVPFQDYSISSDKGLEGTTVFDVQFDPSRCDSW
jgi:hypothetical protein